MHEEQVKSIQDVIVAAKQNLVSNLSESTEQKEMKTLVEDLSILNQMLSMLGIRKAQSTQPKVRASKTAKAEKSTVSAKTRKPGKKNTFYIGDEMKGLRPKYVNVLGEKKEVSSFRDVARTICEMAFSVNANAFKNLQNIPEVNGSEHMYFAGTEDMLGEPTQISSKSGDIFYVDVTKLSGNNMLFLRKALKALGIDEKEITIEVDPSYRRKPRTVNGAEA